MSRPGRKLGSRVVPQHPARGMRRHGLIRVYVGIAPDQFDDLSAMAQRGGIGLSEQIRDVLEWGMEGVAGEG